MSILFPNQVAQQNGTLQLHQPDSALDECRRNCDAQIAKMQTELGDLKKKLAERDELKKKKPESHQRCLAALATPHSMGAVSIRW